MTEHAKAEPVYLHPAMPVPSERDFSSAGVIITMKHNSLEPVKAELVLVLMDNQKDNFVIDFNVALSCCLSVTAVDNKVWLTLAQTYFCGLKNCMVKFLGCR